METAFKMLWMSSLWVFFNFQVEVSPNFATVMHQSALGLFSPANFAANDLGLRCDGLICARIRHLWGWKKPGFEISTEEEMLLENHTILELETLAVENIFFLYGKKVFFSFLLDFD